jgi:hypothetical protein
MCLYTSYPSEPSRALPEGRFCREREVCKMQEKGGLQEAALITSRATFLSPQTVTESFSLVERLGTPS